MSQEAQKIIVAFDRNNLDDVHYLIDQLKGSGCYAKVGMELYMSQGPKIIELFKENGFKIFLDLKLHDIPNTVAKTCASLSKLEVDILNLHASGGSEMMKAALKEIENSNTKLIAVTQLTSTSKEQLNRDIGIQGEVVDSVVHYAKLAYQCGLHGVVASAKEVCEIYKHCPKDFLTITPGIRPTWANTDDQKRVMTPAQAIAGGSTHLVIGRPITNAANPRQALDKIIEEIEASNL